MAQMTRRRWIASVTSAAIAGVTADAFAIEPNRVTVSRHRLGTPGGTVARIAHLTDLHLQSVGRHEERIATEVAALRPNLILLTGDSIDDAGRLDVLERFLALLDEQTVKLAILGNWEHWAGVNVPSLARVYERRNCRLLRNESVVIPFGAAELLVTGLDDLVGGTPDVPAALAGAMPRPNHLLLAHCPMHRDVFRPAAATRTPGIDPRLIAPQLMLAGHTHGGQIAPLGWAPLRPRGSGRYVRGWYRDDPIPLYVSRGLGTSIVPARFCAAPEVAYFEWTLAAI
jgi:predicted MPP superfamily phosphohydrolase